MQHFSTCECSLCTLIIFLDELSPYTALSGSSERNKLWKLVSLLWGKKKEKKKEMNEVYF